MCAAPKGNQFWKLRSKHGRDRLFASPQMLLEAALEYFAWCDENPWISSETTTKKTNNVTTENTTKNKPTQRPYLIEGLTLYCCATLSWWRNFKANLDPDNRPIDKDFMSVMEEIEQIVYNQQLEGATVGVFNANIIARKLGLVDKVENHNINREAKPLTDQEIKDLNDRLKDEY